MTIALARSVPIRVLVSFALPTIVLLGALGCSSSGATGGAAGAGPTGAGGASGATTGGGATLAAFGCGCAHDADCDDGLICYAFGQGSRCTALCHGGTCDLAGGDGCNNMDTAVCKPPSDASCPGAATTSATTGSGGAPHGSPVPFDGCCAETGDCATGLICADFDHKGHRCTPDCSSNASVCDAYGEHCGGMGTCAVPGAGVCL